MKSYKDKQYLVFKFDDGKDVKYDLATGESIGKSGKVVKDVCTQLRGYDYLQIIESFEDEKYKAFLKFVDNKVNRVKRYGGRSSYYEPGSKAKNVGTFLKKINEYSIYEQFFAAGVTKIDYPLNYKLNEIPKGLMKLHRQYEFVLTNELIIGYTHHKDLVGKMLELELNNISQKEILRLLSSSSQAIMSYGYSYNQRYKFFNLVERFNYNPVSLIRYLDNLITYEALEGLDNIINELYDYVLMMGSITNKFEKYPKNFLTTHRIASRNYSRMKINYPEEIFKNRICKDMEFKCDGYKIIYPERTQDIKEEGVKLNHCVASYIQRVIDGKCHILFLRNEEDLDKNLVTLEVRDNKVVQARGAYNRELNKAENEVVKKYEKRLGRMEIAC